MAYDANYINELDETTPLGSEAKSMGDNAIREIKRVLKTCFPNVTSDDIYGGTLTQLGLAVLGTIQRDMIIPWAGDYTTNPEGPFGYTICDGRARRSGGGFAPDLRGKFLLGSAPTQSMFWPTAGTGNTGGNTETDIRLVSGGTLKAFSVDNTTLTAAQSGLPAHTHTVTVEVDGGAGSYSGGSGGGHTSTVLTTDSNATQNASSGHNHAFTIAQGAAGETLSNVPPYYTVIYLIKD
jgi:hypothetical protein